MDRFHQNRGYIKYSNGVLEQWGRYAGDITGLSSTPKYFDIPIHTDFINDANPCSINIYKSGSYIVSVQDSSCTRDRIRLYLYSSVNIDKVKFLESIGYGIFWKAVGFWK